MTRLRLSRVSAVVVRQRELGEADRILVLYSRERGKLSAVAKGVRRPRSKLAGSLQLFSQAELQLAAGRSLDVITQARSVNAFYHLRQDMQRYVRASYLSELVDVMTEEGMADPGLFGLLVETLSALDSGGAPDTLTHSFEVKLLSRLGYGPELDSCASCGAAIAGRTRGFSVTQGGVLCAKCLAAGGGAALSAVALRALRDLRDLAVEELAPRRLTPAAREEIGRIMKAYVPFHVGRELRSASFLASEGNA
ncbi:MAG: DNA repair protein RecO [Armatimonadota bacterium]